MDVHCWSPSHVTQTEGLSQEHSLGYVRGLADTHGSLHLISGEQTNQRAITSRSPDKIVLDELALHLDV